MHPIDRSYERLVEAGRVGIRYRPGTTQPELWCAGEGDPPYEKEVFMGDQQVSVGRNVHFSEDGKRCLHANVSAVNEDGTINIGYLAATGGSRQAQNVNETPGPAMGTWHWPERV